MMASLQMDKILKHDNMIYVVATGTAGLVLALFFFLFINVTQGQLAAGGEDGKLGGDFTLQSIDGSVTLSEVSGKIKVLYFGFTNCQKICPASMTKLHNMLDSFDENELNNIQVYLITVDPERDTVHALANYTKHYHSNIIGLSGTQQAIDDVISNYGAYFKLSETEKNSLEYSFRHSSRYFIVNKNGELIDALRHGTTTAELIARIKPLVKTGA